MRGVHGRLNWNLDDCDGWVAFASHSVASVVRRMLTV